MAAEKIQRPMTSACFIGLSPGRYIPQGLSTCPLVSARVLAYLIYTKITNKVDRKVLVNMLLPPPWIVLIPRQRI